jgi:membrane protein
VLAVLPGIVALLSLVALVGRPQTSVDTIYQVLDPLLSADTLRLLRPSIDGLATPTGAGLGLALGAAAALLAASGYVGAFSRAMNRVYEVEEGRTFLRLRSMQLLVTVASVVLCAVALVILVVSGPVTAAVGNALGVGADVQAVWDVAKWPALAVVVMVLVALLYWATPNVRFSRFRIVTGGSFMAILVWLVASVGVAYYVATVGSDGATPGTLGAAVVALAWVWLTNVALVLGAELDAELERGRELKIGLPAEEVLQLPVRDDRGTVKARARRSKDVARQREIRLAAGGGDPADRPFGRR